MNIIFPGQRLVIMDRRKTPAFEIYDYHEGAGRFLFLQNEEPLLTPVIVRKHIYEFLFSLTESWLGRAMSIDGEVSSQRVWEYMTVYYGRDIEQFDVVTGRKVTLSLERKIMTFQTFDSFEMIALDDRRALPQDEVLKLGYLYTGLVPLLFARDMDSYKLLSPPIDFLSIYKDKIIRQLLPATTPGSSSPVEHKPSPLTGKAAGNSRSPDLKIALTAYETLERFVLKNRVGSYDRFFYCPSPFEAIYEMFMALSEELGELREKTVLDLGTGPDLRVASGQMSEALALPVLENLQSKLQNRKMYKIREGVSLKELARAPESTPGAFQGYVADEVSVARSLMAEGKPILFVANTPADGEKLLPFVFEYPNAGVIARYGNGASHVAVLTRLAGIPSLIGASYVTISGQGQLLIDGNKGILYEASNENVLEENGVIWDASYGINIPAMRKEFLGSYLNADGHMKPEFTIERLEELNQIAGEKFKAIYALNDAKAAFVANLEKHFLHDLLSRRQAEANESGVQVAKEENKSLPENEGSGNGASSPVEDDGSHPERTLVNFPWAPFAEDETFRVIESCRACGSKAHEKIHPLLVNSREFSYQRCCDCGFISLNPQPSERYRQRFYQGEYPREGNDPYSFFSTRKATVLMNWINDLAQQKRLPTAGLVQVGAENATLLLKARELGWQDIIGVDISPEAVRALRAQGIDGQEADIALTRLTERKAQVIILTHVLNHVPDPRQTLADLRGSLQSAESILTVVYCPLHERNSEQLNRPFEHLHFFAHRQLKEMLKRTGYVVNEEHTQPYEVIGLPVVFAHRGELIKSSSPVDAIKEEARRFYRVLSKNNMDPFKFVYEVEPKLIALLKDKPVAWFTSVIDFAIRDKEEEGLYSCPLLKYGIPLAFQGAAGDFQQFQENLEVLAQWVSRVGKEEWAKIQAPGSKGWESRRKNNVWLRHMFGATTGLLKSVDPAGINNQETFRQALVALWVKNGYTVSSPVLPTRKVSDILREIRNHGNDIQHLRAAQDARASALVHEGRIREYVLRLELLHALGVLSGRVLYPSIGDDYFPAYFAHVFGVDTYEGLGRARDRVQLLEQTAIRQGLPVDYEQREKNIQFIPANIFDYHSYLPAVLASGNVDVLFIKGITGWSVLFNRPHYQTVIPTRQQIRQFIMKNQSVLLKDDGFIIIADANDAWLASWLIKEKHFKDILKTRKYRAAREVLSLTEGSYVTSLGSLALLAGRIPLWVLQKKQEDQRPRKIKGGRASSPIEQRPSLIARKLLAQPTSSPIFMILIDDHSSGISEWSLACLASLSNRELIKLDSQAASRPGEQESFFKDSGYNRHDGESQNDRLVEIGAILNKTPSPRYLWPTLCSPSPEPGRPPLERLMFLRPKAYSPQRPLIPNEKQPSIWTFMLQRKVMVGVPREIEDQNEWVFGIEEISQGELLRDRWPQTASIFDSPRVSITILPYINPANRWLIEKLWATQIPEFGNFRLMPEWVMKKIFFKQRSIFTLVQIPLYIPPALGEIVLVMAFRGTITYRKIIRVRLIFPNLWDYLEQKRSLHRAIREQIYTAQVHLTRNFWSLYRWATILRRLLTNDRRHLWNGLIPFVPTWTWEGLGLIDRERIWFELHAQKLFV